MSAASREAHLPLLVAGDISLRLHGRTLLDSVSLTLNTGDFGILLGGNGAGKTTLLRVLTGILRPTQGRLRWFGETLAPGRDALSRIGYLPQSATAETRVPLRVVDVVALGRRVRGSCFARYTAADRAAIDRALDILEIAHLAQRSVGALSGGESRRMHLARVLCQNARVLLLDEPVAHLDLGARLEFLDCISRLHAHHGMTLLMTLHDLESIPAGCNRAWVLDAGRCRYDGPPAGVFAPEVLRQLYGERAEKVICALQARSGWVPAAGETAR